MMINLFPLLSFLPGQLLGGGACILLSKAGGCTSANWQWAGGWGRKGGADAGGRLRRHFSYLKDSHLLL